MLTDTELTQLRADILETLPDTCVIRRGTVAANDYGYPDATWGTAGTVICRVDPYTNKSDSRGVVGVQEASRNYRLLTVEWNADIQPADRVTFGSETYEVLELFDDHSLRAVRRANVVRVD